MLKQAAALVDAAKQIPQPRTLRGFFMPARVAQSRQPQALFFNAAPASAELITARWGFLFLISQDHRLPRAGNYSGAAMFENPYFKESELACRCCGKNHFKDSTLKRLIRVRERFAKPIIINSGYRCPAHNAYLNATMTHATGQAVDIAVALGRGHALLKIALEEGFTGVGVKQKGPIGQRFIHLDDLEAEPGERTRPTIWSY